MKIPTLVLLAALGAPGWLHAAAEPQKSTATAAASQQIDALLAADWKKHNLQPNPPASDAVFVRRIYLDVAGRIPTYRETEEFLNGTSKDKRAELIDKLLASDGYRQNFFNYWADILRAQSRQLSPGGITGAAYMHYIKDSLRDNKPYDQFVRELVSAQGKAWENGAIGYYLRDRQMPLDNTALTVRIFLGTRIECAQCHNHPFDKWKQMQFYQMAAFTYDVESDADRSLYKTNWKKAGALMGPKENEFRKQLRAANGGKDDDKQMAAYRAAQHPIDLLLRSLRGSTLNAAILSTNGKKLQLPHDYEYSDAQPKSVVQAATMMGPSADCPPGAEGMKAYAEWMTSKDNPRFTTVIANRLWKKVFGLGLIEPVDELMDSTVAMNPELMAWLEKTMKSVNYDMKAYLRALLNTEAYQRGVSKEEVPAGATYHFTGPVLRRMSAEQMWDSFVALINPTPDMPNPSAREEGEKQIAGVRKMNDALESLTPEEMLKGAEAAVEKYRPQLLRMKEIEKEVAVANAKGDKEKQRELNKEFTEQLDERRRIEAKSVADNIYLPAVQKLAAKVSGKPTTDAPNAAPQPRATPHPATQARAEAIKAWPELSIKGSSMNRKFLALYTEAQKSEPQLLAQPDWPLKLAERAKIATAKAPAEGATIKKQTGKMNMMGGETESKESEESVWSKVQIPGYDQPKKTGAQLQAEAEAEKKTMIEEAAYFGIPNKEQEQYIDYRRKQQGKWLRAAEIGSPAPRGHYLRQFGQSDRVLVENGNSDASVPQALVMMNSELLPQIMEKYSQLMLTLGKARQPDDQVAAAYVTLLSRQPTANEKRTWLEAHDKGLSTMEDLIYALINTQQFIFIQ